MLLSQPPTLDETLPSESEQDTNKEPVKQDQDTNQVPLNPSSEDDTPKQDQSAGCVGGDVGGGGGGDGSGGSHEGGQGPVEEGVEVKVDSPFGRMAVLRECISRAKDHLSKCAQPPGLKWVQVLLEPDDIGRMTEIRNANLAAVLRERGGGEGSGGGGGQGGGVDVTQEELESFGVVNLSFDCYVRVEDGCWRPAGGEGESERAREREREIERETKVLELESFVDEFARVTHAVLVNQVKRLLQRGRVEAAASVIHLASENSKQCHLHSHIDDLELTSATAHAAQAKALLHTARNVLQGGVDSARQASYKELKRAHDMLLAAATSLASARQHALLPETGDMQGRHAQKSAC